MIKQYTLVVNSLCSGLLLTNADAGESNTKTAVGAKAGSTGGAAVGADAGGALGRQLGK